MEMIYLGLRTLIMFHPIKSMKFWPGNSLCIYLTKKLMHDLNVLNNLIFQTFFFTGESILLKWGFKRIDFVCDFNEINQWFVWNNVQSNSLERDDQTSQKHAIGTTITQIISWIHILSAWIMVGSTLVCHGLARHGILQIQSITLDMDKVYWF